VAPPFRILLVDDFEPFRRFVRFALQARAGFTVVDEASDGLEAVQKAKDLQPDFVLLDIGLPKLNGMAAAEQIRRLAPQAKLLFISMESSDVIVKEAVRLGAAGYLQKIRAQVDLIPAMEAVLAGQKYLSSDLQFTDTAKVHRRHEVQLYSHEMFFLESAARLIAGALRAGGAAVVFATNSHRESLLERLKADAVDINGAIQQGTYISLNAAKAVSKMLVNGLPDRGRWLENVSNLVKSCVQATGTARPPIAFFGECSSLLLAEGNTNAAIQTEKICNDLIETIDVDVLCAYPQSAFQGASDKHAFESICSQHTAVLSR
jgi:DNA-binding NarL/FixJ family response regulator